VDELTPKFGVVVVLFVFSNHVKSEHLYFRGAIMKTNRRDNWMVDKELQEGFSRRLLVYGCGTWLAIFALPICMKLIVTDLPFSELATQLVSDMWFPMIMSLLVFPIAYWDIHRYSHRVAGPIGRVNSAMRKFTDREKVAPIKLRENDFCQELADNFNQLMQEYSSDVAHEEYETSNV